jgi:hypothetical protein
LTSTRAAQPDATNPWSRTMVTGTVFTSSESYNSRFFTETGFAAEAEIGSVAQPDTTTDKAKANASRTFKGPPSVAVPNRVPTGCHD